MGLRSWGRRFGGRGRGRRGSEWMDELNGKGLVIG